MQQPVQAPDGGPVRVPTSTYRLQMNRDFGFAEAAAIVGYLADLGISHAYCSPYLQAEAGSSHGYDVSDHTRVNQELGGAQAHAGFCRSLREAGLGQVLDVVPNHMSIASEDNEWWWDVLKRGEASPYARHFDIDWGSEDGGVTKVLVPILADHYGRVLDAGEIRLSRHLDEVVVTYQGHRLPIDPATIDPGPGDAFLERAGGDPDTLHALLERQHYRLASWRTATQELMHRRFFDVNTLAGLRMEDESVFIDTHALVLRWLDSGVLDGVRVDHPDGLRDPEQYFARLRETAPWAWIVAEKILNFEESLVPSWPVAGTTGYEFAVRTTGIFVDPAGERPLTALCKDLTGIQEEFAEVVHAAKLTVITDLLGSDLARLARLLNGICESNRRLRDHTPAAQRAALEEMIACLPVYRTYVRTGQQPRAEDVAVLGETARAAAGRRSDLDAELFELISALILGARPGEPGAEFAARFQQTTGAVSAKGVEDTAFYRYNRLLCLNEVGGDPGRWGASVAEFHSFALATAQRWPGTMLAGSTHDTKRGEDVRARLALLSEIPTRWETAVRRWFHHNQRHHRGPWPDANAEYHLYQTLVGAHPLGIERCRAYMEKALREAKVHTNWLRPDPDYERAVRLFIDQVLGDDEFTADLARFVAPLVGPGRINSLAMKLLTMTAPGVPDIYQGSELWDLSLVDPDNRRPVDHDLRRRLLAELDHLAIDDVWARSDEGLPKLLTVSRALRLRRKHPGSFGVGSAYLPLQVTGTEAAHLVAFARLDQLGAGAVTLVPRLVMGMAGEGAGGARAWRDTVVEVPAGSWRNVLTGDRTRAGTQRVGEILGRFPVALLSSQAPA